jgi:hypothetical protein
MKKLFFSVILVAVLTACSDKNAASPKAETKVSIDLDKTKEQAKQTFQKAEREIEKGAAKAKDKLEDAGDAIGDKFAKAKDKLTDDDKPSVKIEVKKD